MGCCMGGQAVVPAVLRWRVGGSPLRGLLWQAKPTRARCQPLFQTGTHRRAARSGRRPARCSCATRSRPSCWRGTRPARPCCAGACSSSARAPRRCKRCGGARGEGGRVDARVAVFLASSGPPSPHTWLDLLTLAAPADSRARCKPRRRRCTAPRRAPRTCCRGARRWTAWSGRSACSRRRFASTAWCRWSHATSTRCACARHGNRTAGAAGGGAGRLLEGRSRGCPPSPAAALQPRHPQPFTLPSPHHPSSLNRTTSWRGTASRAAPGSSCTCRCVCVCVSGWCKGTALQPPGARALFVLGVFAAAGRPPHERTAPTLALPVHAGLLSSL